MKAAVVNVKDQAVLDTALLTGLLDKHDTYTGLSVVRPSGDFTTIARYPGDKQLHSFSPDGAGCVAVRAMNHTTLSAVGPVDVAHCGFDPLARQFVNVTLSNPGSVLWTTADFQPLLNASVFSLATTVYDAGGALMAFVSLDLVRRCPGAS